VPREIITLIGKDDINSVSLGDHIEKTMTILFSDIRDFTSLSEEMTPKENFTFINSYMECMNPVIARNGGIIDKYIGDAIMALFPSSADEALRCAIEMLHQLHAYNKKIKKSGYPPVKIGLGINTGLMMLGIIGDKKFMETTVISDAVNLASRIESLTKDYKTPLLISEHTYYSLKDASLYNTRFVDRVKVKGKAQCQSVYEVFDADQKALREAKRKTKIIFEEALAHYHFKDVVRAIEMLEECLRLAPNDTVAKVYHERCMRFLETGIHESSGEFDLAISWNKSLMVDHSKIDHQHRDLFARVRNFANEIKNSKDYLQLCEVIGFLDDYITVHFDTEESFMAEKHYPFLQMQIEQHRRFSKYFNALKQEISDHPDTNRVFLLFRVQLLIVDWLMNHTSKLDTHFGKFLRQHR
jgi:hemerythrin